MHKRRLFQGCWTGGRTTPMPRHRQVERRGDGYSPKTRRRAGAAAPSKRFPATTSRATTTIEKSDHERTYVSTQQSRSRPHQKQRTTGCVSAQGRTRNIMHTTFKRIKSNLLSVFHHRGRGVHGMAVRLPVAVDRVCGVSHDQFFEGSCVPLASDHARGEHVRGVPNELQMVIKS